MLKELINDKWKEAFKARDIEKRTAYELIKQRIMVAEKSGQVELPLTDDYIINLIAKELKERADVLTFYNPEDEPYIMAKAVIAELEKYLPQMMSEDEVIAIIARIKESESNLGKVIGLTIKEVGNAFDKSKIAALVKSV
ncbi:MAG: GatB/YqeY domain-containing protein [Acholeplasmatales bacterium]|nr:GatB/YqeY domain-containing protein [Acholeplasmatales bacterium]